ncbi:MAG: tetratricopeptide repeat protein, partial [Lachnospiraceae bacterium]|nr:tetratricopeptide repeat protein [Lachnospiraceae bacterium]
MQKSMKIVIGVTAAAVLAVGGLAGYRMYGTYQTNKQAEALAKEQKLQRDTVASYADKTYTGK